LYGSAIAVKELAMTPVQQPVPVATAMGRGFKMKCPHCGSGDLFSRFLKIADHCPACREEFHHHRADDFPAYLVIVVVGHIIVPAILAVEIAYAPPTWLQLVVWLPLTLIGSLGLLQPTKGAIVGLQWQAGMHGFAAAKQRRLADSEIRVPAATPAVPLTGRS
jgi:uncharacterized protein (DUF983 family)